MVAKNEVITDILKKKNLNITEIRRQVLLLLLQPGTALTQKKLEESLEKTMGGVDRVTLYRTIRILLDKQVIHQIPIDAQTVKYKLAKNHKNSDHPHFHCSNCDKLVCIPQIQIDNQMLPEGYMIQSSHFIIEGICAICNKDTGSITDD